MQQEVTLLVSPWILGLGIAVERSFGNMLPNAVTTIRKVFEVNPVGESRPSCPYGV